MKPILSFLLFVITLFANIRSGAYDAQDHRIAKIVEGTTTTYLVDPNTPYAQVIRESKENGTEVYYTYGKDLLSDGSHTFLTDALGSTRGLADRAGQLTDSYDYSPYGTLLRHSGSSDNPFLFTGEQYDPEAGLYYLRARYYSPKLARFLSRDTYEGCIYNPIVMNKYAYANGNPVTYVDPSGKFGIIGVMYTQVESMLMRGARMSAATKRVARGFRMAYKTLCTAANKAMGQVVHLHHVLPVGISGLSRTRGEFVGLQLLDSIHRTFHSLLNGALRLKGYPAVGKPLYHSLESAKSYREIFNILMDSAGYFDKVCEPKESMRSKIWKELYGGGIN